MFMSRGPIWGSIFLCFFGGPFWIAINLCYFWGSGNRPPNRPPQKTSFSKRIGFSHGKIAFFYAQWVDLGVDLGGRFLAIFGRYGVDKSSHIPSKICQQKALFDVLTCTIYRKLLAKGEIQTHTSIDYSRCADTPTHTHTSIDYSRCADTHTHTPTIRPSL